MFFFGQKNELWYCGTCSKESIDRRRNQIVHTKGHGLFMLLTANNALKIAADKTDVAPATLLTRTGHRAKNMVIVDLQF